MAATAIQDYIRFLPVLNRTPQHAVRLTYVMETDTLSVHFKKPGYATDSEMMPDDVIVRYEGGAIVGFTVLHASRRTPTTGADE